MRNFDYYDPPDDYSISPESEEARAFLEQEKIDPAVIEHIFNIIDTLAVRAYAECPYCTSRAIEEEAKWAEEWGLVFPKDH